MEQKCQPGENFLHSIVQGHSEKPMILSGEINAINGIDIAVYNGIDFKLRRNLPMTIIEEKGQKIRHAKYRLLSAIQAIPEPLIRSMNEREMILRLAIDRDTQIGVEKLAERNRKKQIIGRTEK
jgi:hypothetical protein